MLNIKDLYKAFVIGDIKNTEEEPDVEAWYSFLDSLKKPKDVFEESFNKYLCRMYYFKKGKTFLLNIISFIVLIPVTLRLIICKHNASSIDKNLLLLEEQSDVSYKDVFPFELVDQYDEFKIIKREKGKLGVMIDCAKSLYLRTWRKYWLHPYFLMWVMKELSSHSHYIERYNPKALVFYINERNVVSPILTKLYEDRGGKLISFMHGEYLLQLIQGYMHFSEYYIWDESYIDMFREKLHCHIGKYILYLPNKMKKKWKLEQRIPQYTCTYYFSGESEESIRILAKVFSKLEENGIKCKVRPHPRVSHYQSILENFGFLLIEDVRAMSLEESLAETEYVIGLNTTVLSEGLTEGRKVIIDDISNPDAYKNLIKRNAIAMKREHITLSEYLLEKGIKYT